MAAVAMMAVVSCSKQEDPVVEDSLSLDQTALSFDATGTPAQTIKVTCNGNWTVTVDTMNPWVKVTPVSGSKDGYISVSADANESTTDARNGSFTVTCGTKKVDVTVAQAAAEKPQPTTKVYIKIGSDEPIELKADESITGLYSGTVNRPATGNFVFIIDGEEYGFLAHSGAGGIGEDCKDLNSGLPVEFRDADPNLADYKLAVDKAFGSITKDASTKCPLWLNYSAAGKMYVSVNKEYMAYCIANSVDEANVIYKEYFDLIVGGGSYSAPFLTYTAPMKDGMADALGQWVTKVEKYTVPDFNGAVWTGDDATATKGLNKKFLSMLQIDEWLGIPESFFQLQYQALQIGGTSKDTLGVFSPKFKALTGNSQVEVTLDLFRFAPGTTEPIHIDVLGGGQITSGSTTVDYIDWNDRTPKTENWTITEPVTRYTLADNDYFSHTTYWNDPATYSSVNAKIFKPISHMTFTIKNATAETQLYISAKGTGGSKGGQRLQVHGLKVVKK